ncbi:MAG TPA: SDR family oxidoreductase, partial [Blastocatellia bacterium]|nr:SDR family oxidoreductase [Blastocatellia bacterium]
ARLQARARSLRVVRPGKSAQCARLLRPRGIRVNALSAGPVKTLASAGIGGFSKILEHMRNRAPLRRNIDQSEVADAAMFLLSNMSRGVTGEILHVDCGYNIMGM